MQLRFLCLYMLIIFMVPLNADSSQSDLDVGMGVTTNHHNDLTDEFCKFILESAPAIIKDKIALLDDIFCPLKCKPRRLLLYGPSGSGKTTLAQVIAHEIKRPFVFINAGLLGNEYKNSIAQNLRRAIEPHISMPCVVIIDEIDCILKQAKDDRNPDAETPKQIWEIFDICSQYPHVLLIGITNDITGMPEPLQTRFAGDTIEIPLTQSQELRKKIILFHLKEFATNINDSHLNALSKKTKNFSHRELEKMVLEAAGLAYLRYKKALKLCVTNDDFEKAYKRIESSRSLLKKFKWSDYEKHLQYGLQIAGLVVNIASFVQSWRMSWLSYILSQKSLEHQKQSAIQSQQQADRSYEQNERNSEHSKESSAKSLAQSAQQFEKSQKQSQDIADRADRRTVAGQILQKIGNVLPRYWDPAWNHLYYGYSSAQGYAGAQKVFNESIKALKNYGEIDLEVMVDNEMKKTA